MAGNVIETTDSSFDSDVLKSDIPVLVDFWAPWCGPCRMIAPVVETLSEEHNGKMKFVKVNTDENQQISQNFNISGIPTLLVFKNGEVVDQMVGAAPPKLKEMVSRNI